MRLVAPMAKRVARSLPVSVELDDLIQCGFLGLMKASARYNPKRGVPFPTYARYVIRGAIIDSVRRRNYHYELHSELSEGTTDTLPAPDQLADAAKVAGILLEALAGLTAAERSAILQRAEGASFREIGAAFGHETTWAFKLVQVVRHKLKRVLAMYRLNASA